MNLRLGLIGLTLTSAAAFSSAKAADMYVPGPASYKDAPVYSAGWAGWYAGANGGYGWKSGSDTETVTAFNGVSNVPLFNFPGAEPAGGFGGGQIGYNFQRGHLVFGFETDIQGAGINDDKHGVASVGLPTIATTNVDWFGTSRARTGYAWDGILVYATGGLAYGGVTNKLSTPGFGVRVAPNIVVPVTFAAHTDTETGFTIGGGIEYKINPVWSVKAEYQFIDLGSVALTSNIPGVGTRQIDNNFNTVRAGVNYHILPAYEPLK